MTERLQVLHTEQPAQWWEEVADANDSQSKNN
jgi:hypothetical protein